MDTAINFRDFGGLETRLGSRIRKDLLYRSGHLAVLSDSAARQVVALDFALVADLRYPAERKQAPSPWPQDRLARIFAHQEKRTTIAPHLELMAHARAGAAAVRQFYIDYFSNLPFHPHYRPLFARVLNHLAEIRGRTLVHCTAGKDRTGMLVALIHHALDVPRSAIVENFLLSENAPGIRALAAPMEERLVSELGADRAKEMIDLLFGVDEAYLAAAFGAIEARCGSVDDYLAEMGLTPARRRSLQQNLLES